MRIGNKIINTPVMEILTELKFYLKKNNIDRFRDIHNSGNYIMVSCPFHKNGHEQHASCGILKRDYDGKRAGWVHCFTCGYSGSFDEMISSLMGFGDNGEFGRKWLLDNFINSEDYSRNVVLDLERKHNNELKIVPESELSRYRYYHKYWEQRKIPESICVKFDLGYDKQTNSITMPFWDINGNCIGVTRRAVYKKYYHIPQNIVKPVYLLNFAVKEKWLNICLCESQINALYLNSLGYHSCACFGTGTVKQAQDIAHSGVRSVVICFDGDMAGRNGRKKMLDFINKESNNQILCSYIELPDGKDVNDLSAEEISKLMKNQKYV